MRGVRAFGRLVAAVLAMVATAPAAAGVVNPGYYVVTVYDDPGVRTVDFRYWTVRADSSDTTIVWPEVGLGWNVKGRWYTELLASWIDSSKFPSRLETLNWQNDVLLTQGQYPFDLAVHTLLVRPQNPASGWALESARRCRPTSTGPSSTSTSSSSAASSRSRDRPSSPTSGRCAIAGSAGCTSGRRDSARSGRGTAGCRRTSSRIAPGRRCSARSRSTRGS